MSNYVIILLFLMNLEVHAQDFKSINSNNVLDYYSNNQSSKGGPEVTNTHVLQYGVMNITELMIRNSSVDVVQYGNYNNAYFDTRFNIIPDYAVNVEMYGNYNRIDVYGSNKLSNGMNLQVFGSFKTVIVTNR